MKKTFFILFILLISFSVSADDWSRAEKISPTDLPQKAQALLKKHFGDTHLTEAYKWPRNYSVYLQNGEKISFFTDGSFKEAETNNKALPISLLSEFSGKTEEYVKGNYAGWDLVDVEIKRTKIELELESRGQTVELEFSLSGDLIKVETDD